MLVAGSACTQFPSSTSHVVQLPVFELQPFSKDGGNQKGLFQRFGVAHVDGCMYFVSEISHTLPPLPAKCNFGSLVCVGWTERCTVMRERSVTRSFPAFTGLFYDVAHAGF